MQSTQIPSYLFTHHIRFVNKVVIKSMSDNKFLVIKRSKDEFVRPNTWDIAGGGIIYPELHHQGLIREVFEETGLYIVNIQDLIIFTGYDQQKDIYSIIIGSTAQVENHSDIRLSAEHVEYAWMNVQDYFQLYPNYIFMHNRPFDIQSTDFIADIIYKAYVPID